MLDVPFYKPWLGANEINEVLDTLKSGWLTTGPKTKRFELEFAEYLRRKHTVAVNSCTAALHLALEAMGLNAGEGVIVPTMTFAATAEVVRYFGATPVLVDCRTEDLNMDLADAERKLAATVASGNRVSAIIPMHYGGQIGDMAGTQSLAGRHHLKIVEDAAHCCPAFFKAEDGPGAKSNGAKEWLPVGKGTDITCFSFYANKCITTGEGGMACTDNDEYADRMRIMSLHGISKDAWKRFTAEGSWYYEIVAPGYKYNMTDIAAAIGIHQLRRADELHQKRRNIAALYTRLLGEVDELILPREMPNRIHSWHLYAIRLKLDRLNIDRAQVIQQMKEHGTMKARPGSWPCGLAMCSVPPVVWSRSSSARSPKAARSP
jgi:perosamine synthetase